MSRSIVTRIGLLIALGAFWWYGWRHHSAWTQSLLSQTSQLPWTATWWVGGVSEGLLLAAAVFMFVPMKTPHRGTDAAMGIGCARMGGYALFAIAFILALAMVLRIRWLIHMISLGTICIAVWLLIGLAYETLRPLARRFGRG